MSLQTSWPSINLQSSTLIPKRCSLICSPTKYPASKDSFSCPYTGIPLEINVSTTVSTTMSFPADAITSAQTSGSEQYSITIAPTSKKPTIIPALFTMFILFPVKLESMSPNCAVNLLFISFPLIRISPALDGIDFGELLYKFFIACELELASIFAFFIFL